MSEFGIGLITKEKIGDVAGILAPEVVSAIKKDLPATALAVVKDGSVIGALGGEIDTDTFYIVSIYVLPEMRRQGAATALMKKLFELCDAEELMVRAEYTPVDSEGDTIAPFLRAMDFIREEENYAVCCVEQLEHFEVDERSLPLGMSEIMSFKEAGADRINRALHQSEAEEGKAADLKSLEGMFEEELSFIAIEKEIFKGCVLAKRVRKDLVQLSLLWPEKEDIRDMKLMTAFSLDEIKKTCPVNTRIVIPEPDSDTRQIIEEFGGGSADTTLSFVKREFEEI